MRTDVTLALSEHLADIAFAKIPSEVIHLTKRHVLDCIGVAVAGGSSTPGSIAAEVTHQLDLTDGATVLATGRRASVTGAAWANGVAAHALDFDDTGFSHPTACILPAVLAVAESRASSGEALLSAMTAGYEAFERIASTSRALEPGLRAQGFHPTALYGCAAAAAAVGNLIGLNAQQMAVALGLSLTNAGGLNAQIGTWGKGVHAGNAARAGVMAAFVAARNFWAASDILEAEYGFYNAVFGRGAVDVGRVLEKGTAEWSLQNPGLNIKPYPACGRTLRAIDASLRLRQLHVTDPALISSVTVETFPDYIHTLPYCAPTFGFHGKFSLDYCIAVSLFDGRVGLESFSDESARRPALRNLLERVTVVVRDDWSADRRRENPVTITLNDGSQHTEMVNAPRGSVANPMTDDELGEKFAYCCAVAGVSTADQARDAIMRLDQLASVAPVIALTMVDPASRC